MKVFRTIVFTLAALVLLAVLAAGVGLYTVYRHPHTVKPLAERVLSGVLQGEVSIEALAFGVSPIRVTARGVRLGAPSSETGAAGELAEFRAEATLSGPFGRRILTVETLVLSHWWVRLPADAPVLRPIGGTGSPSLFSSLLQPLIDGLLFRKVRFGTFKAEEGRIEVFATDWRLEAEINEAGLSADGSGRLLGSGRFESPPRGLSAEAPEIAVRVSGGIRPGQTLYRAEVAIERSQLHYGAQAFHDASLRARVFYDREHHRLRVEGAELKSAGRVSLKEGAPPETIGEIGLQADLGWYDPDREAGALPNWRLHLDDWLEMAGSLSYDLDHGRGLKLDVAEGRILAETLLALAQRQTDVDLKGTTLSGPLTLGGTFEGHRRADTWDWVFSGSVGLVQNPLSADLPDVRLSGRLTGYIAVRGRPDERWVQGDLDLAGGQLALSDRPPTPFRLQCALEGAYPDLQIGKLDLRFEDLSGLIDAKGSGLRDLRLVMRNGRVHVAQRSFDFPGGTLTASPLGPISLSLKGNASSQNIAVQGRDAGLVTLFAAAGGLPPAWKVEGADRLEATAVVSGGRCRFDAELGFERGGFEDPKGEILGEKLALELSAGGQLDLGSGRLELKADGRLSGGEALVQQFYFDFKRQPLELKTTAIVDLNRRRWQAPDFLLELKDIARIKAAGNGGWGRNDDRLALLLELPTTALGPLYRQFVLDPFGTSVPALKTLTLGGMLSADLQFQSGSGGQRAKGRIRWTDGRLASPELGVTLDGAALDFPLWAESGSPSPAGGAPLKGRLSIARLDLPLLGTQTIDWPLQAAANRLDVTAATGFDFAGGIVALGPIHLQDPYRAGRLLKSEISVRSVDSRQLLGEIWPEARLGTVDGEVGVVLRGDRLIGSGRLDADMFGGRVTVVDPSARALFSAAPIVSCEVRLEDVLLSDLTGGTPFGKVEGVLQGSIADLEIVDGQPQHYDLLLETERKRGVRQRISVKAVNSISQIGGGRNAFAGLAGSALKLLPGFGYRKIGIRSTLSNDVFTVNGTIRDGGVEYLVRRDGLAGVDVVNRDPQNRIRFTEMLKRIRRAMEPENKPVVNVNQ